MAHLHLSLLKSFQVTLDGQPIIRFRNVKGQALLAYLVVEAEQRVFQGGFQKEVAEQVVGASSSRKSDDLPGGQ